MSRLRSRLAQEHGIALVLALGIMLVFGIATTAAIAYSNSNSTSASRSSADQVALAAAEAGLANAAGVLQNPANASRVLSTASPLLPATEPATGTAYERATARSWGVLTGANLLGGTWRIYGSGTMPSPTASGAVVRRVVSATVTVKASDVQTLNNLAWRYVYSKNEGAVCDETIYNNTTVRTSMYVRGNLCFENSAALEGPTDPSKSVDLQVRGSVDIRPPAASIGKVNALTSAHIRQGCMSRANAALHSPCTPADDVRPASDTTVPELDAPNADFASWYATATPGAYGDPVTHVCGGASGIVLDNNTVFGDGVGNAGSVTPVVDLAPTTGYDCVTPTGRLKWDPATDRFTISGTLYIDGSAIITDKGVLDYDGAGTLYLSGTFFIQGTKLCGKKNTAGTGCDFAGWNPDTEMFMVVANGNSSGGGVQNQGGMGAGDSIDVSNSSLWQGGMYATNIIRIDTSSNVESPMIAGSEVIRNKSDTQALPEFDTLPVGTPGNQITSYTISAPTDFG